MSRPALSPVIGSRIGCGASVRPASRRRQLSSSDMARHPQPAIRRTPSPPARVAAMFSLEGEASRPARAGCGGGFGDRAGSNLYGGWLREGAGRAAQARTAIHPALSCVKDRAPAFRTTENAA